jgi:hypothetical protein
LTRNNLSEASAAGGLMTVLFIAIIVDIATSTVTFSSDGQTKSKACCWSVFLATLKKIMPLHFLPQTAWRHCPSLSLRQKKQAYRPTLPYH